MINKIGEGYEYVCTRGNYYFYRKIENGKGKWKAENTKNGVVMDCTYDQARGFEPMDNIENLSMMFGRILLPKKGF